MFHHYFVAAWRNLTRHKLYSAINILGLATGMAACIVIMLFVYYEQSFDGMHHRNLYRLDEVEKSTSTGTAQKTAETQFPMGPTLKNEFPEVVNFCRVDGNRQYEMTYGEKTVFFPMTCFVDTTFLQMFDFPLVKGDRQTALQMPNSIVLTESASRKLFGTANPIGKTVLHFGADTLLFTVTGILKDLPANSHFQFDALQSFNTVYRPDWMNRGNHAVYTYLELAANTGIAGLEKKFPAYLKAHRIGDRHLSFELFLQPLSDVHGGSGDILYDEINSQKFDRRYTRIFMSVGVLVLLIAVINFINLSTARSAERGKEVGIRKVSGAMLRQLRIQFVGEAVLFSLIALAIALLLVIGALPYIDKLSGRNLSALFYLQPGLLPAVFLAAIAAGVLSGLYPAVYLSAFQPVKVLKGGGDTARAKGRFRSILVVGQFASAIFLVIVTLLIFRQLNYMEKRDPGFDRDQVIIVPLHGVTSGKYAILKEELTVSPLVTGVTGAQDHLGGPLETMGFGFWPGNKPMRVLFTPGIFVGPDYLNFYRIPLLAGRNFLMDTSAYNREFIINETLARQLLNDQPRRPLDWLIGKHFGGDTLGSIVGITKDFNFNSLHYKIGPLFLLDQGASSFSTMSVKITGRQARQAIDFIQSAWKKVLPGYPIEYQFLDDHFRELYRADAQVSQLVAMMAGLAILISCLGLFGLASFSAEKRTREIGIRKVLGASVKDIVFLLTKHFIALVGIANLIAWPLAWLALHRWIQDYAYRVAISWWVFILAGISAVLIALGTVSYLAIKAARSNPVESLRTE